MRAWSFARRAVSCAWGAPGAGSPPRHEVRIRLHASGVCHSDSMVVRHSAGTHVSAVPGQSIATIEALGADIDGWQLGRVSGRLEQRRLATAAAVARELLRVRERQGAPASRVTAAMHSHAGARLALARRRGH